MAQRIDTTLFTFTQECPELGNSTTLSAVVDPLTSVVTFKYQSASNTASIPFSASTLGSLIEFFSYMLEDPDIQALIPEPEPEPEPTEPEGEPEPPVEEEPIA